MVLGANDGLVSTAALMMGVGGGTQDRHTLILSGVAGLVAGALSMSVGEYISVSSQASLLCMQAYSVCKDKDKSKFLPFICMRSS